MDLQLENARKRKPGLELRFTNANFEVIACTDRGDDCTVAEKEIKLLSSNNAATAIQDNTKDIKKYEEDLEEKTNTYNILLNAFDGIKEGAAPAI